MKFKAVFILFNAVVLLSFLFIFLMPLFFLGPEYTRVFWGENWYLALIFVLILAGLNGYFIANWRLFSYLEREEWDKLAEYLERRIFHEGRYRAQEIRLLIHSYVALNRAKEIKQIERQLREHNPSMLERFALPLGVPHLLSNDGEQMAEYYGEMRERAPRNQRPWAEWAYGFGLMLSGKTEAAKPVLQEVGRDRRDPLLQLLTLYLLDAFREHHEDIRGLIDEECRFLRERLGRAKIESRLQRSRGELHILVVSKLVESAMEWCFQEDG